MNGQPNFKLNPQEEEAMRRKVYEQLMQDIPGPAPQPSLSSVINKFTQQGVSFIARS